MGILSALILTPLLGALALILVRGLSDHAIKRFALALSLVLFGFSLALLTQLSGFESSAEYRFEETLNWLPQWGISYHLGIDGISLWLVHTRARGAQRSTTASA